MESFKTKGHAFGFGTDFTPLPASCRTNTIPKTFLLRYLHHGGPTMPNTELLPALFTKFNENQLALGAAIEELRGSVEVAKNIRVTLHSSAPS